MGVKGLGGRRSGFEFIIALYSSKSFCGYNNKNELLLKGVA